MLIFAIEPGTEKSGFVFYDVDRHKVRASGEASNVVVLHDIRMLAADTGIVLVIENIEGMGFAVGASTFQTCIWIGRFIEAWESETGIEVPLISRGDEKIVMCGTKTFKDPVTGKQKTIGDKQIKDAIQSMFEPTGGGKNPVVGIKKQKGPLYGVKGHAWQALSVALTYVEIRKQQNK